MILGSTGGIGYNLCPLRAPSLMGSQVNSSGNSARHAIIGSTGCKSPGWETQTGLSEGAKTKCSWREAQRREASRSFIQSFMGPIVPSIVS